MRTRADDIARARGGVFDDDHPLAYTGGGVGSTQLQCGSSALAPCPDPELRERRSNLRPSSEAEYGPYADSPPRRV